MLDQMVNITSTLFAPVTALLVSTVMVWILTILVTTSHYLQGLPIIMLLYMIFACLVEMITNVLVHQVVLSTANLEQHALKRLVVYFLLFLLFLVNFARFCDSSTKFSAKTFHLLILVNLQVNDMWLTKVLYFENIVNDGSLCFSAHKMLCLFSVVRYFLPFNINTFVYP